MTSRVLASPRAAWSWHLELTQSPPTLLPTFPPGEGLAADNLPGSSLFSIVERRYCGLSKFYQKKPQDSANHGFTSLILRASQGLPFLPSLMHGMTDQLLGCNQALIDCRLQMALRGKQTWLSALLGLHSSRQRLKE